MRLRDGRTLTALGAAAVALWAVTQGIGILRLEAAGAAVVAAPVEADALAALHRREDLLQQTLQVRPMASQEWLSLAAARNALAMTPASIDGAFMMSALTGPNEADVMAQRALLGLVVWDKASAATRARTAIDLCGLSVTEPSRLRLVVSAHSEAVRADIRSALVAHGCAARMIGRIGL